MQSIHGLLSVIIGGIVLSSAVYLGLSHSSGVSKVAGGLGNSAKTLGNIARGQ